MFLLIRPAGWQKAFCHLTRVQVRRLTISPPLREYLKGWVTVTRGRDSEYLCVFQSSCEVSVLASSKFVQALPVRRLHNLDADGNGAGFETY
jgi:hypothetical protein